MPKKYPRKGGPYWHVIRFLDHPLLPANAGPDVPKIIKHGIDDDGPMHPKSPHCSAPDGVVTMFYKMGREDWLKRFLDVDGTPEFKLHVKSWSESFSDFYVKRNGRTAEIGFLSTSPFESDRTVKNFPDPAVRHVVSPNGDWVPSFHSGRNVGNWPRSPEVIVRGQSELIGKGIWYNQRWRPGDRITEISWTGMTEEEKEVAKKFAEEWSIKPKPDPSYRSEVNMTPEERENEFYRRFALKRRECRGGCGEKNTRHVCGKCKEVYYCSQECQRDDWKWHKSVCGKSPLY